MQETANESARAERFPTYVMGKNVNARNILLFIFFVAMAICFFLDEVTFFNGWSIYVAAGIIGVWQAALFPAFQKKPFVVFVMRIVIVVALVVIALEIFKVSPAGGWMLNYVLPCSVGLGITLIMFSSLIKKVKWSEVSVHMSTLSLFSLTLMILAMVDILATIVLCSAICLYCIICLLGVKYFLSKAFNESFKKRLHI
jgi:hypothetical protein